MYLYFEKHWDFVGSTQFLYKNFYVTDKCYKLFDWQGYSVLPCDIGSVSMINKVWVDINKYTKFGNNIPEINNMIKLHIRLLKIKKLKERKYEK